MNYAPELVGVGRYTGEIGEFFASRGHELVVVTTPPHYPDWRAAASHSSNRWGRERLAEATVYRCPILLHPQMRGVRRLIAPFSFALSSAPVALWQILTRRPDVVVVVEPTLLVAPIALLAARLTGARTVLHVQDLETDAAFAVGHLGGGGLLERCARAFERAATRSFDRVITISQRMADKLGSKGVAGAKMRVIRNWVDLESVKPMTSPSSYRRELGLKDDDFVVLYSGTLGAKQGVQLLIDAAKALEGRPNIVFVVAGEGPMRPDVERAAASLPNLRVFGFQPEARLGDFLSIADVHVLPQQRAAADLVLPSKLGGMLASGRRIVITADPGTELADFAHSCCALTPPGDADALAQAILAYSESPADPGETAERLLRAQALSKRRIIHDFEAAALFYLSADEIIHPVRHGAETQAA